MATTNEFPQPIIDLLLADVNAVLSNLSILITSYRLLVGGAEEIRRTPDVCPDVFERAIRRADNAGTLIDIYIDLLYCKMSFSSDFLKISGAPVDLFRLLANPTIATDTPFHTAEQVVEIAVLRRILEILIQEPPSIPEYPTVICPTPPPPSIPASPHPSSTPDKSTDFQEVEAALLSELQTQVLSNREEEPLKSRVRRKHLKTAYDKGKGIKK